MDDGRGRRSPARVGLAPDSASPAGSSSSRPSLAGSSSARSPLAGSTSGRSSLAGSSLARSLLGRRVRREEPTDGLCVEWFGSGVLVCDPADSPYAVWQLLRTLAAPSDDVLVLVSARAHRHPDTAAVLRSVLTSAAADLVHNGGSRYPARLWFAVSGAGRADSPYVEWLTSMAREYGTPVLAPDGPIVLVPGGSLYAGVSTGASGWRVIRADGVRPPITDRYPVPVWDLMVPYREVGVGSLIAQPLPTGVILRESWSAPVTPDDDDFMIAVDPRHPTVVLAHRGVPRTAPSDVAALFARLPPESSVRLLVSSTAGADPDPSWMRDLAALIPHDGPAGRSVPALAPMVLDHGWTRHQGRVYRRTSDPSIVAEVMPAGILLRPAGVYTSDSVAMFDPGSAILTIGSAGVDVSALLVDTLHRLLSEQPPDRAGTIRLQVAGIADRSTRARIASLDGDVSMLRDEPPPVPPLTPAAPSTAPPPPASPPAAPSPAASSPAAPSPAASSPAAPPPITSRTPTAPTMPVAAPALSPVASTSSVSGRPAVSMPSPSSPPLVPLPATPGPAVPVAVPVSAVAVPVPGSMPASAGPIATTSGPASESGPASSHGASPASSAVVVAQSSGPAGPTGLAPGWADPASPSGAAAGQPTQVEVPAVADRSSTADEQRRFTAALGAEFTDSLATVNAALSTWPALRQDDSPGAKADYVAVCVYLGLSRGGAVALNASLRSGNLPDLDGYLPCLVSGLRRLPLHRRPVLCQGHLVASVEQLYTVGAVVVEPGFRSASVAVDVAVPGADVDVLIWSRTARQLSVLAPGRTFDEAVFPTGTRFKVLDVKASWTRPADDGGTDGARLPEAAVLLREVLADEDVSSNGLDAVDQTVLARLDKVLVRRRRTPVHTIDDADLVARLTGPLPGLASGPRRGSVTGPGRGLVAVPGMSQESS